MRWDKVPDHLAHRVADSRKTPATVARKAVGETCKASKYNAVRCEVDGLKFDSRAEGRYYSQLLLRQAAGEVLWFIRQPSFDVAEGVKYRADFLEVRADGTVAVVDVKGFSTPTFKIKRRLFESAYPIKLEVVK